jgi:NADPH:quinone reductase-like Zn-dependent oxidoreductase
MCWRACFRNFKTSSLPSTRAFLFRRRGRQFSDLDISESHASAHKANCHFYRLVLPIDQTGIKPVIDAEYALADLPAALDHLARGPFGKIVVKMPK